MPPIREFKVAIFPADSLWLEVCFDDSSQVFELRAGDERAITVGSDPRARLRVARSGVAPIAFHFEREEDEVYIVPGYQAALRVNAQPVRSRIRLPNAALIELHGVSIDVRLLDERPECRAEPLEPETTREHVRSYQVEQPLDSATVRFSVPGLDPRTVELPTTAIRPDSTERIPRPSAKMLSASSDVRSEAFLERTLVIERPGRAAPAASQSGSAEAPGVLECTLVLPGPVASTERGEPARVERSVPLAPAVTDEARFLKTMGIGSMVAWSEGTPRSAPRHDSAAIVPAPILSASISPVQLFESAPATPRVQLEAKGPSGLSTSLNEATTSFEAVKALAVPTPSVPAERLGEPKPSATLPQVSAKKAVLSMLVQLGLHVQKRPVPVLAAALGVALVMGLGLAGITKVLGPFGQRVPVSVIPSGGSRPHVPPVSSGAATAALPIPAPTLVVSPVAPVSAASVARAASPPSGKVRQPADPELAAAVAHLSAGHYADAASAYAPLSRRTDGSAPLRRLAELLELAASPECKPSANRKSACPEVLR